VVNFDLPNVPEDYAIYFKKHFCKLV
jgi:hypothetical protein